VHQVVPFEKWLEYAREPSSATDAEANPAAKLAEFSDQHFVRTSSGQVVQSQAVSRALRSVKVVDKALVNKYIRSWKNAAFLKS
jgi:hypothetical protein